jgi:protein-S-isoprenylcysteine O-methyltransferase Ste14
MRKLGLLPQTAHFEILRRASLLRMTCNRSIATTTQSTRLFALARSAVVATLFVGLWTWLLPSWFATMAHRTLTPDQPLGLILLLPGAAIMLRCVFDFAWSGRGTPAPFDPPRALVVTGLYRYVRNPMYVGMGLFLIGEALLFPAIRVPMFATVLILWLAVHCFIIFYEEPTLRRSFGSDYEQYCRNVRRWWPRLTPYHP